MKISALSLLVACGVLTGCVSVKRAELVASYFSGPACAGAQSRHLEIRSDGTYTMLARAGFTLDPWEQSEEGVWFIRGGDLVLKSDSSESQRLRIEQEGTTLVWLPAGAYAPVFTKEGLNPSVEPTPAAFRASSETRF